MYHPRPFSVDFGPRGPSLRLSSTYPDRFYFFMATCERLSTCNFHQDGSHAGRPRPLGTRPPSAPSFVLFATNYSTYLTRTNYSTYSTRTNYSIFKQNKRIQIRLFIYQIQSIVFMQTAMADLSHNKNIDRQIARSSVFFKTVYGCVNEVCVDTQGYEIFLRYV